MIEGVLGSMRTTRPHGYPASQVAPTALPPSPYRLGCRRRPCCHSLWLSLSYLDTLSTTISLSVSSHPFCVVVSSPSFSLSSLLSFFSFEHNRSSLPCCSVREGCGLRASYTPHPWEGSGWGEEGTSVRGSVEGCAVPNCDKGFVCGHISSVHRRSLSLPLPHSPLLTLSLSPTPSLDPCLSLRSLSLSLSLPLSRSPLFP